MPITSPAHMLIDIKVKNIERTLGQYINQLKSLSPYLRIHKGQAELDPSGFIQGISDRVYDSVKSNNLIVVRGELFYCRKDGTYDHRRVQSFLEETYELLRSGRFTTLFSVYRFYRNFYQGLVSLRRDGY
jgi:hypothetical protein